MAHFTVHTFIHVLELCRGSHSRATECGCQRKTENCLFHGIGVVDERSVGPLMSGPMNFEFKIDDYFLALIARMAWSAAKRPEVMANEEAEPSHFKS